MHYGAPRAKPVVPRLTPMWGDIPVIRLHIPTRPEAVVSCGRDEYKKRTGLRKPQEPVNGFKPTGRKRRKGEPLNV